MEKKVCVELTLDQLWLVRWCIEAGIELDRRQDKDDELLELFRVFKDASNQYQYKKKFDDMKSQGAEVPVCPHCGRVWG